MRGNGQKTVHLKIRKLIDLRAEFFCPLLLGIFVAASFIPFLMPGIPAGTETEFHISRIGFLASALANGDFPVLINTGAFNGFGHGAGLFLPDILLLPAAVLVNCSVPIIAACKIFIVLAALFTAYGTWYTVWKITRDPHAAYAGGMLYTLCSYFACNYFVRGAFDEWLAMAFLPWVILGIWQVVYARKPAWGAFAFGMAGVLAAHPGTAFLACLFSLVIFAVNYSRMIRRPRRIVVAAASLLTAAGLNLYWGAPALEEMVHTDFAFLKEPASDISSRCVPLTRLVLETPYSREDNWIPAGIGIIFAVLLLRRWRFGSPGQNTDRFRDLVLLAGSGALLAATDFLPWEWQIPGAGIIVYPWRTYSIASCALAVGGGMLLAGIFAWNRRKRRFWMILVTLGAFSGWWFTTAGAYMNGDICTGVDLSETHPGNRKYLPVQVSDLYRSGSEVRLLSGEGEVTAERISPEKFLLKYSKTPGFPVVAELPAVCFRGWYGRIKGLPPRHAEPSESSLVTVRIPAVEESGIMEVVYNGTAVQKVSAAVSVCFFTFAIGALLLNFFKIEPFRKKRNNKFPNIRGRNVSIRNQK